MIIKKRKVFINVMGREFILPFGDLYEDGTLYGISAVIEFRNKVMISFSTPDKHKEEYKSVICFDRHTSEILWQIDPVFTWKVPNNRNRYLDEEVEYGTIYSSVGISAYYKSPDGHLWIEEEFNENRGSSTIWGLEEKGFVVRHPDYHNNDKYKLRESNPYYVHKDTHECVLADYSAPLEDTSWIGGRLSYTDITDKDEQECLLSVISNYGGFVFEVDIQTGKVKPAYANIAEEK